ERARPGGPVGRLTVVYDGDCGMCQRSVEVLRRWDHGGSLEIVASQAPGVRERFPWIPPRAYERSLQVVDGEGTTWSGAAAFEVILNALPRRRWLAWIFRVPFARPVAERVYRSIAARRARISEWLGAPACELGDDAGAPGER
ncbi:MAG: DUF393 domain-containing protein, partial [Gemmatimonadetes bacterium]